MKYLSSFLLLAFTLSAYSQKKYDLIVKTSGDSIACKIDIVDQSDIFYEIKFKGTWIKTHSSLAEIQEYQYDVIEKNTIANKAGSMVLLPSSEVVEISNFTLHVDAGAHLNAQASVNVEALIAAQKKVALYGRLGFGGAAIFFGDSGLGALAALTMLVGERNNHFEINGGLFLNLDHTGGFTLPVLDLGYRYQKPEGGFIFRAKAGILGVGIGIGYAF